MGKIFFFLVKAQKLCSREGYATPPPQKKNFSCIYCSHKGRVFQILNYSFSQFVKKLQ
jgi:hypothetical protein